MDLIELKAKIRTNLRNLQGWSTNRRIIVIESDDWGSIRMPSIEVYKKLLSAGIRVDKCPYNRFDSIETEADMNELFNIIKKIKALYDYAPVVTTNFIIANPDFQKIKESGYRDYFYELFTDTYKKYPNRENVIKLLRQGIDERFIYPQFHGREHLNINRWMTALRKNLPETRFAFENGLFGLSMNITNEMRGSYLAALDFDSINEIEDQKKILIDGLTLFSRIFGYQSRSFIAPNYSWHTALEKTLADNSVNYLQGSYNQVVPSGEGKPSKLIHHRIGRYNSHGQVYLVRNCFFEPSIVNNIDPVKYCLDNIEIAFRWNKPAIISSHRVNFIGSIIKENRENNLRLFFKLLKEIAHKWREVEFLNSEQLGDLIFYDVFG